MSSLETCIRADVQPPDNLLGQNRARLDALFERLGEKRFRTSQVLKWIHQHRCDEFSRMSNLSKVLREKLERLAEIRAPALVREQVSADGSVKWLLRVDSGNCIE